LDLVSRIPRLNTEGASGPTLTFDAVTHRDPDRLALAHEPDLPAAARRLSHFHAHVLLHSSSGQMAFTKAGWIQVRPSQIIGLLHGPGSNRNMRWRSCDSASWVVTSADDMRRPSGTGAMAERHHQKPSAFYPGRNGKCNALPFCSPYCVSRLNVRQ
jgi:hypothetical protein